MIEICKNLKINHKRLEGFEINIFIYLLTKEKIRHEKTIEEIEKIDLNMHFGTKKYMLNNNRLEKIFWNCEIKRHIQDINSINNTIKYLSKKIGEKNEITCN
jgi:ribosomal protein L5